MKLALSSNHTRQGWITLGLLLAITLFVYLPVRHHDFVSYDDIDYVTENPRVLAGLTWPGVQWAFTTGHACNWHPLTWLSHMLDAEVFGKNPAGHHLVNVLFHLANTALIFAVISRLTGALWRSLLVAALFALHPLRVESVAWIAERKDVLSAFFFLLSLGAYARYAAPKEQRPTRRPSWYGMALLFFALGLMCKPMLVTLPCVLLLLDLWPLQRIRLGHVREVGEKIAPLLVEKIPFFLLSAASCVITFVVQQRGGAVRSMESFSWGERLGNAFVACARYLEKTLWPADLAVFYPHPGHWPFATMAVSTVLVAGLTIAATLLIKRAPFFTVGWFWFIGMLVPTIGLVQVGNQAMADRYTYLPCIGLFIAVIWPLAAAAKHLRIPRTAAAFAIVITLALPISTARQLPHWQDSERLYTRALGVTQRNYVAYNGLGYFHINHGRVDEGMADLQHAIEIHPRFAEAHTNYGCALLQKGRDAEALASFQRAVQILPSLAVARYNLGTLLYAQGRHAEAARELQVAATLRPDDAITRVNLGNALLFLGRLEDAAASYREALRIQPDDADAHSNLGFVLTQSGRVSEAIPHLLRAVTIQPAHANAYYNLGDAQSRLGHLAEASASIEKSLALQPNDAEAKALLDTIRQEIARAPTPGTP